MSQTSIELTTRCSSVVFLQEGKKYAELIFYLNGLGVGAPINAKVVTLARGKLEITGPNIKHL